MLIYRWVITLGAFGVATSRPQFPTVNSQLELIMPTTNNFNGLSFDGSGGDGEPDYRPNQNPTGYQLRKGPIIMPSVISSVSVQSIRIPIPDQAVISPPGLVFPPKAPIMLVIPHSVIPSFYN